MLKPILLVWVGLSVALIARAEKGNDYGSDAHRQRVLKQASLQVSNANRPTDTALKVRCWNKLDKNGGLASGSGRSMGYRQRSSTGGLGGFFSRLFGRDEEPVTLNQNQDYDMYVVETGNKMANWETPVVIITPDGKKVAVKVDGTGNNCNIDKKYKSSEDYMEQEVWSKPEYQENLKKQVKAMPQPRLREIMQECSEAKSRGAFSPSFKTAYHESGIEERGGSRGPRSQESSNPRSEGGGAANKNNGGSQGQQ